MNPQDPNQPGLPVDPANSVQPPEQPQYQEPVVSAQPTPEPQQQPPQQVFSPEQPVATSTQPQPQPQFPQQLPPNPQPQNQGSPLAAGSPGQDYYDNDKKSPVLGIIALVLTITVLLAPIGFILGIISIVKGARGKNKSIPLIVMGAISVVIGIFTSLIMFTMIVTTYYGVLLKANSPDYSKTTQKTFENSGGKITIAIPEKYSTESEGSVGDGSDAIKLKAFSYKKVDLEKNEDVSLFGDAKGGVFVGVTKTGTPSSLTSEQLKEVVKAQPDYVKTVQQSFEQSFAGTISGSCSDTPEKSSSADLIEYKYFDINIKFTCTLKETDEKYTAVMKVRVALTDDRVYMAFAIEKDSLYQKQASDIDSAVKNAKFE